MVSFQEPRHDRTECGEEITQYGGVTTHFCELDAGHPGPHMSLSVPKSVNAVRQWKAAQGAPAEPVMTAPGVSTPAGDGPTRFVPRSPSSPGARTPMPQRDDVVNPSDAEVAARLCPAAHIGETTAIGCVKARGHEGDHYYARLLPAAQANALRAAHGITPTATAPAAPVAPEPQYVPPGPASAQNPPQGVPGDRGGLPPGMPTERSTLGPAGVVDTGSGYARHPSNQFFGNTDDIEPTPIVEQPGPSVAQPQGDPIAMTPQAFADTVRNVVAGDVAAFDPERLRALEALGQTGSVEYVYWQTIQNAINLREFMLRDA